MLEEKIVSEYNIYLYTYRRNTSQNTYDSFYKIGTMF